MRIHPRAQLEMGRTIPVADDHYDHCFESLSSHQTKLRFVLEASGFGVVFFGQLFAKVYRRNLERAIPLLVSEIESNRVPV